MGVGTVRCGSRHLSHVLETHSSVLRDLIDAEAKRVPIESLPRGNRKVGLEILEAEREAEAQTGSSH